MFLQKNNKTWFIQSLKTNSPIRKTNTTIDFVLDKVNSAVYLCIISIHAWHLFLWFSISVVFVNKKMFSKLDYYYLCQWLGFSTNKFIG